MFGRWKSAALHGLIGLTALAIVPLSCILVMEITREERAVRRCVAAVCTGPQVDHTGNGPEQAVRSRLRLAYDLVNR